MDPKVNVNRIVGGGLLRPENDQWLISPTCLLKA